MTTQFTRRQIDAMLQALGSFATECDAQFYLCKTGGEVSEEALQPILAETATWTADEAHAEYAKFGLTYGE